MIFVLLILSESLSFYIHFIDFLWHFLFILIGFLDTKRIMYNENKTKLLWFTTWSSWIQGKTKKYPTNDHHSHRFGFVCVCILKLYVTVCVFVDSVWMEVFNGKHSLSLFYTLILNKFLSLLSSIHSLIGKKKLNCSNFSLTKRNKNKA